VTAHDRPRARGTVHRGRRRIAALAAVAIAAEITIALTGAAHAEGRTVPYQCNGETVDIHYPVATLSPTSAGSSATLRSTLQPELTSVLPGTATVTGIDVDVPYPRVTDDRMIRSFTGALTSGGNLRLAGTTDTGSSIHLAFTGNRSAATIEVPTIAVDILIEAYYFSHGAAANATSLFPDITVRADSGTVTCRAGGAALGTTVFSPPRGTVVTYPSSSIGGTSIPTPTATPTTGTTTTSTTTTTHPTIPPKTTPPVCRRVPQWLWQLLQRLFGIRC
jgi:hypothetical protein